jgi:signal transduction histidine kinase
VKRGGVGLGLPIVSRLVTALAGSIDVQSEGGTGTTFAVVLPFEQALTPPQRASA